MTNIIGRRTFDGKEYKWRTTVKASDVPMLKKLARRTGYSVRTVKVRGNPNRIAVYVRKG